MLPILIFIAITSLFFTIGYIYRIRRFLLLASKIPSPKGHIPFIGAIPIFLRAELHDLIKIFLGLYEKFGKDFYKIWFGNEIYIPILNPEMAKQIINSKKCLARPNFFTFFGLPHATFHGSLENWRIHRKILNPAFNIKILKTFIPTFNEKSKKMVKSLECFVDKGEFDIFPHNACFFLENILNINLDLEIDIMNHEDKEFYIRHFDE